MRNYFSVTTDGSTEYVFFDDAKYEDIREAFDTAEAMGGHAIAAYAVPFHSGPWDQAAGIIGHRRRGDILADIDAETDRERLDCLAYELQQVDRAYYVAGRDTVPMQSVGEAA